MKNTKTITLAGEETEVVFDKNYPYFWVQNLGENDVYISLSPGISPGADGVITVPAGGIATTGQVGQQKNIYLSGSGKVQVFAQYNGLCPSFKRGGKGGESGTGDYEKLTNLPSVNGVVLTGEKSLRELGAAERVRKLIDLPFNADSKYSDAGDYSYAMPDSINGFSVTDEGVFNNTSNVCLQLPSGCLNNLAGDKFKISFDFRTADDTGDAIILGFGRINGDKDNFFVYLENGFLNVYTGKYYYYYGPNWHASNAVSTGKYADKRYHHFEILCDRNSGVFSVTVDGWDKFVSFNEYLKNISDLPDKYICGIYSVIRGSYQISSSVQNVFKGYIKNFRIVSGENAYNESGNYILPAASETILGGVKPDGETVSVGENGVISANYREAIDALYAEITKIKEHIGYTDRV